MPGASTTGVWTQAGRWAARLQALAPTLVPSPSRLPGCCAVCRAWPARPVCDDCVARFAQPLPRCPRCALPVAMAGTCCAACRASPPPLDACLAAVDYAYPWAGCVAQFKFQGQPGWASMLALLMRSAPWVEPALDSAELLLPMPLSAARLRERGFNQALLLARALDARKTDAALLLRVRDTPAQHALPRGERMANVRGAFAVEPLRAQALQGRRLLLVDDVMTSGASLHEAARVLRAAGAAQVSALVFARTPAP